MNNRDEIIQKEGSQVKGEYRIDEMVDKIYDEETMSMEDGSDLLTDGLTEEEKARILNIALRKIGKHPEQIENERTVIVRSRPDKAGGRRRRILAAALVAVFAFATTAFAAEVFQWDVRISNFFGIEGRDGAGLAGGGMNVGVSTENNGVTIEAVQAIGDGTNLYILFDVTAPKGKVISYPDASFEMIRLRIGEPGGMDGPTGMGYGCTMLEDDDDKDNKATFLLSAEADKKINNKKINIEFENLRHYITGSGEMVTDAAGIWELEWELDYEDTSTKYKIGKELAVNGKTIDVDSISISPIALNVGMSGSYFNELDSAPRAPGEGDPVQINAITLKDGTMLTQQDSLGWGCSIRDGKSVINMQMKKLLDPDKVKSVTLNDTEFILPQPKDQ